MSIFDGVIGLPGIWASRGDVIGVHRKVSGIGLYDHYGIYENDRCIYEYGGSTRDFDDARIRMTTLEKFVGDSDGFFIRVFPARYEDFDSPRKRAAEAGLPGCAPEDAAFLARSLQSELARAKAYRLRSPDETIARAKSRLGETKYSLMLNNCEHYAIWCKTGLHESGQVDAVLAFAHTALVAARPAVELAADHLAERHPLLWSAAEDAASSGLDTLGDALGDAARTIQSYFQS